MKYVFVGNRKFVLLQMLKMNLDISRIYVVCGSHLQRDLECFSDLSKACVVGSLAEMIVDLRAVDYDIMISNGCPFILPDDILSNGSKHINIHPSLLPDLKGVDPVIGAIMHYRDAGATCHHMSALVDSGDIISQVKIPISDDLDSRLLYQLSFLAEQEVFEKAYQNQFCYGETQVSTPSNLYYTRKETDREITFNESADEIIRKVKAFNTIKHGAYFFYSDEKYHIFSAKILHNDYLKKIASNYQSRQVCLCYESCLVVKINDRLIMFDQVRGDLSKVNVGDRFGL